MNDKIDTLHPINDLQTNIYPNIVSDNIPDGAVTESKIADGSIINSKIKESSISADKLIYDNTYDVEGITTETLSVEDSSTLGGKVTMNSDLIVKGTAYLTSPSITGFASVSGLSSPANMTISGKSGIEFIIGSNTLALPNDKEGTLALKEDILINASDVVIE